VGALRLRDHDSAARARTSRYLAVGALVAGLVVLVVSFIQGPPDSLPAVALGWPVLLYLERAALVAGVIIGIGGTADRLLRGDAVQGFSAPGGPGVQVAEQAAAGVADAADNAAEAVEAVKKALDEGLRELDERLARLEGKD
jgi:hypothetical protein